MKYFMSRRRRNIGILLVLVGGVLVLDRLLKTSLRDAALVSGWTLLTMVLLLAAYNVRKKLPFLPLGSSSTWLQIHIYLGLLAAIVFGTHIGWRIPNGIFESLLAAVFVLVCGSGIAGLVVSRTFARRITARGPEVIYERIPRLRSRLRLEVEQLVLQCLQVTESSAVHEFYSDRLEAFFAAPRNFVPHLVHSTRPSRALMTEIEAQDRFLNDDEKQFMRQITSRVQTKDDLDYQYAHQAILKYWLFLHIPLTYALLVFSALHAVLVHAFRGVMP
jgi:hypothetical protein